MARSNYSFVIDDSFRPFEMQELLTPMLMYKDVYEKQEEAWDELNKNTDTFKYLEDYAKDHPDSKAAQIYTNYANDMYRDFSDFSKNGLSMGNRRSLLDLKRRYAGEIGQLVKADETLQALVKDRRSKGSSWLWGKENLSLDDILEDPNINPYGIDSNELYARGAAAGKAASSRLYNVGDEGSTLNGYYRRWVEKYGYSKESIDAFRTNISALPELQQAAYAIMKEKGAADNLTGNNYDKGLQSVINGIIDGAIYQEKVTPVRDEDKMSAAAREQYALQREQMAKSAAQSGLFWDTQSNSWKYDIEKDPAYQRQVSILEKRQESKIEQEEKSNQEKKSGTTHNGLLEAPLRITFNSPVPEMNKDKTWKDIEKGAAFEDDFTSEIIDSEDVGSGKHYSYHQLPSFVKRKIPNTLDKDKHFYMIDKDKDTGGWGFLTPNHYTVTIIPTKTATSDVKTEESGGINIDKSLGLQYGYE